MDFSSFDNKETIDDDVLIAISEKFMKQNAEAYKELAK